MADVEVTRIKVGKHPVGVVELKKVLADVAAEFNDRSDEEIRLELVTRLAKRNYISPNVRKLYEDALFREYKKFVGEPITAEKEGFMEIKMLGPGCPNCERLEKELMALIAELNLEADLEHVRDIKEISRYGVMGTPALVINGKVMAVGNVPPKSKLTNWLEEASETKDKH